jgi:TolB-like protein/DNA-binding winged helix-turn-helix (wHTH) protein/Tfp pilus assembly protein PilF
MERAPSQSRVLKFGVFEVDLDTGELRKAGMRQKLVGQPFQVLQLLLERPQEVVTREQLQARIWQKGTFVDYDLALKKAVKRVREVLGDSVESPRFIETVPRRGYRFIAPLAGNGAVATAAPALVEKPGAEHQPSRTLRVGILLSLGVAVVLLTLLVFAPEQFRQRLSGKGSTPQIRSLAVLPLQCLSADPAQEYFSDGMTDALTTDLAQISSLKVISRTSSMQYKQTKKSLPEIAHELNVDGIVEGTVQRSGDRVRITAQLIYGPSDKHLWAESYESDLGNILAVQDEVARAIAKEIRVQLLPEESSRLSSAPPINREAYELYLKGRYFWNKRDAEGFKRALDYFQRAAEKDPGYAPVQAGLADTYSLQGAAGYDLLPRAEAMEKARAAAQKAILIDGTLAEAHASLAFVIYSYDWDWAAAEKEFKQAIALNPNYPTAHQWYSEYLGDLGRTEEALDQAQAALVLDPLSLNANHQVARAQYFARRIDQAIQTTQKTLEMNPDFAVAHLRLGRAYSAKGMYGQAIKEFQEFSTLSGDVPLATASIGNALARSGDRLGAVRALNKLAILSRQRRVPSISFALVYLGLGNNDQAVTWLEKAYGERSDFLLVLRVDPLFDGLRPDPRFQDLAHRVGLPP